jgi:hypothetical protein
MFGGELAHVLRDLHNVHRCARASRMAAAVGRHALTRFLRYEHNIRQFEGRTP